MLGYIERISSEIAAVLVQEGLDYTQTKAVFRAARSTGSPNRPGSS